MLLRQFCIGNNLPTHIKENADFPRQNPRQLPNAEENFKDCFYAGTALYLSFLMFFFILNMTLAYLLK